MRLTTIASLKQHEIASKSRDANAKARDAVESANIRNQQAELDWRKESGDWTSHADAQAGAVSGTTPAAFVAAGIVGILWPPAGIAIAAVTAAVVVAQAFSNKYQRDEVNEMNERAGECKLAAESGQNLAKIGRAHV